MAATAVVLNVGCRTADSPCCGNGQAAGMYAELPAANGLGDVAQTETDERPTSVEPDFTQLVGLEAKAETPEYHPLSADEVKCLAVRHSSTAELLEAEHQAVSGLSNEAVCLAGRKPFCDSSSPLRHTLLSLAADQARNESAGGALTLYFTLMKTEGQRDRLREAQAVVDDTLEKLDRLQAAGVQADKGPIERNRSELAQQSFDLVLAVDRLNAELQPLLGVDAWESSRRVWPNEPLAPNVEPIDVPAAVALGVAEHPELNLLRTLRHNLTSSNLPTIRMALQSVDGLLGGSPPQLPSSLCLMLKTLRGNAPQQDGDLSARRNQLDAYLARREAAVSTEIRLAAREIEARLEQMESSRREVQSWRSRLEALDAQPPAPDQALAGRHAAQIGLLTARQTLFEHTVDWRGAHLKLRHAQGLFPFDCRSE